MHPLVRRCAVALALATPGLAVGACAVPAKAPVAAARAAVGKASLALQPTLRPAGGARRRLQAKGSDVDPWAAADVDQIEVSLRELVTGNWELRARAVRLGPDAELPLIFHNLHAGKTYRAEAKAYKAGGRNLSNQISVDAASTLDLTMSNEDAPMKGVLPVQLADKPYAGKASAENGFTITPGTITAGLSGLVVTMAGGANPGGIDAMGEAASLNGPSGVALGSNGYWVVERGGHRVRYVDVQTYGVSTAAGSGAPGFADQGAPGGAAGVAFNAPEGIHSLGSQYQAYVADTGNNRVRSINRNAGQVTSETLAGGSAAAYLDDPVGTTARFSAPAAVWRDGAALYVADRGNNRIRRIDLSGAYPVDTVAGGGANTVAYVATGTDAELRSPTALAKGGTYLYVACRDARQIRRIDLAYPSFPVELVAGTGNAGNADGDGDEASFQSPTGLAYDSVLDRLYVADAGSHRIRMIDCSDPDFPVTTVAGDGQAFADGFGSDARFNAPCGLAFDPSDRKNLLVADRGNHRLRVIR